MTETVLRETNFKELPAPTRGKVRDIFDLGHELVIVTTDRISAFDVILPDPIPNKGKVLTKISEYWFTRFASIIPNHLITTDVDLFPEQFRPFADILGGRSMLVEKTNPLSAECITRGYLFGSGFKDYSKTGQISGIVLPRGLVNAQKLPQAIFTPSTKAEQGHHDVNIDMARLSELVGDANAVLCWQFSVLLYETAQPILKKGGIIVADTKFEFGVDRNGQLMLIDEVLTPDSSRFWPQSSYKPGEQQESFDKQYLRDYLLSINWDQKPPAPRLPPEVIEKTRQKYLEALACIIIS